MGGTLMPLTEADGEALIEHCHVVTSRARLTESGRLLPGAPSVIGHRVVGERVTDDRVTDDRVTGDRGVDGPAEPHLSAHG
jgi:hypothetical protein